MDSLDSVIDSLYLSEPLSKSLKRDFKGYTKSTPIHAWPINLRVLYALKKISPQFGNTPEHRLMFAVFTRGVIDLVIAGKRKAHNACQRKLFKKGTELSNIAEGMRAENEIIEKSGLSGDKLDVDKFIRDNVKAELDRIGIKYHIPNSSNEAHRYLSGDITHALVCGVDSDWVRVVLRKCKLID